jgi:hypothetical protein
LRHSVKHDLSPEQLRLAVQKFAEVYCERFRDYQATVTWVDDSLVEVLFKVKGIKLKGTLVLLPHEIGIEMNVPFAFVLFKNRAIRAIEDEVRPWLDKAARGELAS